MGRPKLELNQIKDKIKELAMGCTVVTSVEEIDVVNRVVKKTITRVAYPGDVEALRLWYDLCGE